MSLEGSIEEACLELANHLIVLCGIEAPRVSSLLDMNGNFFVLLFEKICKVTIPEIISNPESVEDAAHNVQVVIDTLSLDIINISLSHITGEDIVSKNAYAIYNFLEILEGYLLFLSSECLENEHFEKDISGADDESNKLNTSAVRYSEGCEDVQSNLPSAVVCPLCSGKIQKSGVKTERNDIDVNLSSKHKHLKHADMDTYSLDNQDKTSGNYTKQIHVVSLSPAGGNELKTSDEHKVESDVSSNSLSLPLVPLSLPKKKKLRPELARIGVREQCKTDFINYDRGHIHPQVLQKDDICPLSYKRDKQCLNWECSALHQKENAVLQKEKMCENLTNVIGDRDINILFSQNLKTRIKDQLSDLQEQKKASSQIGNTFKQTFKKPVKKERILYKKSVLLPKKLPRSRLAFARKGSASNIHLLHKSSKVRKRSDERSAKTPLFINKLQEEFPGFYMSLSAISCTTRQYERHLLTLRQRLRDTLSKKPQVHLQREETARRQRILASILQKETVHNQHLKNLQDQQQLENKIKSIVQESRHKSALLKHYYDDFHTHMKKRLQKRQTEEELVLQHAFKEGLRLQKEQISEMQKQAQERQRKEAQHHKIYLESLENYYKNQFGLLTESLAVEKVDLQERAKAQARVLKQMRVDFRHKMEREVRFLQDQVAEKDLHFRVMDAKQYLKCLDHKFKVPSTI